MLTKLESPIQFSFQYDDDWHVVKVLELDVVDGVYPRAFSEAESCFENWIQCGDEKIEYTDTDMDENPDWWAELNEGWCLWLDQHKTGR